jgi:hypothetical protein
MKQSFTLSLCSTALISASILVGATAAVAGDAKTYPGSMCVRYSGSNPSYSGSMIGNPSSSQWLYLDCPAINDSMSEQLHNSWVAVLDRHYSSDVHCSVHSRYWNNSTAALNGWWGGNKYSAGSGNNLQKLSWGRLSGAGDSVHTYFSCAIPPAYSGHVSYIVNYHANED